MRNGMRKSCQGFSLIELLASVVILGLALTAISVLFVGGIVSNQKALRISRATYLAQLEMERLRSAGYAGAVVDPLFFPSAKGYSILQQNENLTGTVGFTVTDLPQGQGTIDIDYFHAPTGYYPNLKTITATVTWQGGKPTRGRVVVQSLLANRP